MERHDDGSESNHPSPSTIPIIKYPGPVLAVATGDGEEEGGENVGVLGGTGVRFRVLANENEMD